MSLDSMLSADARARDVTLLGKAEFLNPGFSQKDRIARAIFDEAEATGALKPGGTVIAASSGNTGAAAAMMGAMRGYKVIIVTNSKCSQEKMDRSAARTDPRRATHHHLSTHHHEYVFSQHSSIWRRIDRRERWRGLHG